MTTTAMTTMMEQPVRTITVGVDTHSKVHHAAVLDERGAMLGERRFTTDAHGYQELLDWVASFGIINTVGIECTGSYGAGLTRHLLAAGVGVVEVNRGHALVRSRSGKSDVIDAEAAARKVMSEGVLLTGEGHQRGCGGDQEPAPSARFRGEV
ncbi:IS110 family transposase [Arthrobacter cheniae]|uniref:IS110 family transposase n=1 Tax=Arthrobacter cheniae TaxID=1258888 RepID=UPI001F292443|nr:transposase [Arthrobacter cheniae]